MEPLDNPIWHSLTGPHAKFAEGSSLALRYDPSVALFAALPDEPVVDAWAALRALVDPGGVALVFRVDGLSLPDDWEVVFELVGLQMVATEVIGEPDPEFVRLGNNDAPAMLDLVARTDPGPFLRRTVEMGTYLGVHDDDALVAMAGERMHLPGYTEVSAVCTDERARKRGLATRLVRAIASGIEARDETPMLHVKQDNETAIRVYEKLGFVVRSPFTASVVRAPE